MVLLLGEVLSGESHFELVVRRTPLKAGAQQSLGILRQETIRRVVVTAGITVVQVARQKSPVRRDGKFVGEAQIAAEIGREQQIASRQITGYGNHAKPTQRARDALGNLAAEEVGLTLVVFVFGVEIAGARADVKPVGDGDHYVGFQPRDLGIGGVAGGVGSGLVHGLHLEILVIVMEERAVEGNSAGNAAFPAEFEGIDDFGIHLIDQPRAGERSHVATALEAAAVAEIEHQVVAGLVADHGAGAELSESGGGGRLGKEYQRRDRLDAIHDSRRSEKMVPRQLLLLVGVTCAEGQLPGIAELVVDFTVGCDRLDIDHVIAADRVRPHEITGEGVDEARFRLVEEKARHVFHGAVARRQNLKFLGDIFGRGQCGLAVHERQVGAVEIGAAVELVVVVGGDGGYPQVIQVVVQTQGQAVVADTKLGVVENRHAAGVNVGRRCTAQCQARLLGSVEDRHERQCVEVLFPCVIAAEFGGEIVRQVPVKLASGEDLIPVVHLRTSRFGVADVAVVLVGLYHQAPADVVTQRAADHTFEAAVLVAAQ